MVLLFSSLLHNKSAPFPFIFAAVLLLILCSSCLGELCRETMLKGRGRWDIKEGAATGSERSGGWRGDGDGDRDGEREEDARQRWTSSGAQGFIRGGGQLGACDRPWPLFHTCLAVFAVSDINIYYISHFGERDNSQRWKNNKR